MLGGCYQAHLFQQPEQKTHVGTLGPCYKSIQIRQEIHNSTMKHSTISNVPHGCRLEIPAGIS